MGQGGSISTRGDLRRLCGGRGARLVCVHGRAPAGGGTQLFAHGECLHPKGIAPAHRQEGGLGVLWLWAPPWDPLRPSESSRGGTAMKCRVSVADGPSGILIPPFISLGKCS